MSLLAIPNVSAGADLAVVERLSRTLTEGPGRLLDAHTDGVHNRTVFTVLGTGEELTEAMAGLATAAVREIDLTRHIGVHPRLGALDVCPIVPFADEDLETAATVAVETGRLIADRAQVPVYLYAAAAPPGSPMELPQLRRMGIAGLAQSGPPPDFGPSEIDLRKGVVCVGARSTLIAFNVWVKTDGASARRVARSIRSSSGGPAGIRALGLQMDESLSQISLNLIDPATTGIDAAMQEIEKHLDAGLILRTEIVGLVPERYMPDPDAAAARLLDPPGRSLESMMR